MSAVSLTMGTRTELILPVAVIGRGAGLTARLLRRLIPNPVVELTPCQAAMVEDERRYRAVVVENFDLPAKGLLSPCGAARWTVSPRADVTVVGLDDGEGRRLAQQSGLPVFAYSDGRPQADLAAKNVRMRNGRLEFDALTQQELLRIRLPASDQPLLYDYLAALAGALAVEVPLKTAANLLAAGF